MWAWLHITRLPNLAAGAGTWASQSRCGQPGAHATIGDGRARLSR